MKCQKLKFAIEIPIPKSDFEFQKNTKLDKKLKRPKKRKKPKNQCHSTDFTQGIGILRREPPIRNAYRVVGHQTTHQTKKSFQHTL